MSAKCQKRTFLGAIANDRKIAISALVEEIKRDSDTRNLSSAIRPAFVYALWRNRNTIDLDQYHCKQIQYSVYC